jgi:hypothetical protein
MTTSTPTIPQGSTQFAQQTGWAYGAGTSIPFEAISEPGAYVCSWSGHLLRVPADALQSGGAPSINFVGGQPLFVTKICSNPFVTVTKARLLASNFDLNVNF